MASDRGRPADWIAEARARFGEDLLVDWCVGLLTGTVAPGDPDRPSLDVIGGPGAEELALGMMARGTADHWPRAWAARALRYVWRETPEARRAVVGGLADPAWRVRHNAAEVVAAREVGEAADPLVPLLDDPNPRVRAIAARALGAVGEHEHLEPLLALAAEPGAVGRAARAAVGHLRDRLGLPDR